MGVFTHWPYTNIHEMNLDYILQLLKDMGINVDKFIDETDKKLKLLDEDIKNIQDELIHFIDTINVPELVHDEIERLLTSGELEDIVREALDVLASDITTEVNSLKAPIYYRTGDCGTEAEPTGQGFWIETPEGNAILIDAGIVTQNITDSIKNRGITKISAIIISHYHADHIGGPAGANLQLFLNDTYFDFSECKAYLPHGALNWSNFLPNATTFQTLIDAEQSVKNMLTAKGIELVFPDENDSINIDGIDLSFHNLSTVKFSYYYACTLNYNGEDVGYTIYNNFSMITKVKYRNALVYGGDIQREAEEQNYKVYEDCDIYIAPHHGLNRPVGEKFLGVIDAKLTLIFTGQTYYPSDYVIKQDVQKLIAHGSPAYLSVDAGDIFIMDSVSGLRYLASGSAIYNTDTDVALGFGHVLLPGEDLNNMTKNSSWSVQNATQAAQITNAPITNTGFKGITEYVTATLTKLQRAISVGSNAYIQAVRRAAWSSPDAHTWYKWRYLVHAPYILFDTLTNSNLIKCSISNNTYRQNYVKIQNGFIAAGFDITADEQLASKQDIFVCDIDTYNQGGIFELKDYSNNKGYRFLCGIRNWDADTQTGQLFICADQVVPAGTHLQGSMNIPITVNR